MIIEVAQWTFKHSHHRIDALEFRFWCRTWPKMSFKLENLPCGWVSFSHSHLWPGATEWQTVYAGRTGSAGDFLGAWEEDGFVDTRTNPPTGRPGPTLGFPRRRFYSIHSRKYETQKKMTPTFASRVPGFFMFLLRIPRISTDVLWSYLIRTKGSNKKNSNKEVKFAFAHHRLIVNQQSTYSLLFSVSKTQGKKITK